MPASPGQFCPHLRSSAGGGSSGQPNMHRGSTTPVAVVDGPSVMPGLPARGSSTSPPSHSSSSGPISWSPRFLTATVAPPPPPPDQPAGWTPGRSSGSARSPLPPPDSSPHPPSGPLHPLLSPPKNRTRNPRAACPPTGSSSCSSSLAPWSRAVAAVVATGEATWGRGLAGVGEVRSMSAGAVPRVAA